ncbi:MAG: hypothetical protein ACI4KA_01155 [Oscillospiraceae bacterium]
MNIEFEKALQYIDLGNYNKAIQSLNNAIMEEEDAGNDSEAVKIRCVLGELYVNLGMEAQARDVLTSVVEYCDEHHTHEQQRFIAKSYLNAYDGVPLPKELSHEKPIERPGDMPIIPKPVQNKAFINRQMNKKHR